jgi:hypothetical protein
MMNEFPPKFIEVVRESSGTDVPLLNATEYLEHLFAAGVREADLPALQPLFQKRIWDRFAPGGGRGRLEEVISDLRRQDGRFHMDGGSWTNNLSWVRGYENVIGPMEEVSSLFHETVLKRAAPTDERRYRNALLHLLTSQTSCFRYWGQGQWTDYAREICRRANSVLTSEY